MHKLGIFGGTFDPVHWGHLLIADSALAQFNLEQVIWIPSKNPPHKQAALFDHRVAMLELATKHNPNFTISLIEKEYPGTSYSINTLINLSACYPNSHWYWIIGLDAFQTLPHWYRGYELAQICDWLIAPRLISSQSSSESLSICNQVEKKIKEKQYEINWQLLSTPLIKLSSSTIREFCYQGRKIDDLIPESVKSYIATHNLYCHNSE